MGAPCVLIVRSVFFFDQNGGFPVVLHGEESVSPATAKNQHGGNLVYSAVPVTPVQATPATQKRQQPSIQANHSQIKQTDYKSRLYTGMHPSVFVLVYVVGWLVSPRSWLVCVITSGCVMFCVFHGDARPPSLSLCNHNVCICKRPRLMHALASWHPVAHTPTSLVHTAANPWQHPLSQSFAAPVFRCRVMESRAARGACRMPDISRLGPLGAGVGGHCAKRGPHATASSDANVPVCYVPHSQPVVLSPPHPPCLCRT